MFFKEFKKILVVSPHPDDSEYSCYGMIKRLGCETNILICSDGGKGDSTNLKERVKEVQNFWKESKNINCSQENVLSMDYHEAVKFCDSYIDQQNPDAIFIPPENDTNQEHRFISNVFKSSLRDKAMAVFEYQTPSTTHEWNPNIWLEISSFVSLKKKLLFENFKSQNEKSYFKDEYLEVFHKDWQAFKRGIEVCEKFKLVSWMYK